MYSVHSGYVVSRLQLNWWRDVLLAEHTTYHASYCIWGWTALWSESRGTIYVVCNVMQTCFCDSLTAPAQSDRAREIKINLSDFQMMFICLAACTTFPSHRAYIQFWGSQLSSQSSSVSPITFIFWITSIKVNFGLSLFLLF